MSFSSSWKSVGAGDEVALAVEFDQHADLAAGVDVGAHRAFVGGARRLLLRGGHAALAQHDEACSMSPFDSCRALRQSPMGAPDFSRSSFTTLHQSSRLQQSSRFLLVTAQFVCRIIRLAKRGAASTAAAAAKEKRGNQTARPRLSRSA